MSCLAYASPSVALCAGGPPSELQKEVLEDLQRAMRVASLEDESMVGGWPLRPRLLCLAPPKQGGACSWALSPSHPTAP